MRLRNVLLATLWLATGALAQPTKLMLPSPVQVSGVVVDGSGNPIADVRIDDIDLTNAHAASDQSGHFDFEAKGPSVVFRKRNWKSVLIPVTGAKRGIRVVMTPASDPIRIRACPEKPRCVRTDGAFCLPRTRGVHTGDLRHDIDYAYRDDTISPLFGASRTMTHGAGLAYGGPEPPTVLIWKSVKFSEVQLDMQGKVVLDSHGKTRDGLFWRSIGTTGEIVDYGPVAQKDAVLFDRVLDGLCVLVPNR